MSWTDEQKFRYVPSLVYLCIKKLASFPEQINGVALTYAPSSQDSSDFDILKALVPSYTDDSFDVSSIDPLLWATLVQIFEDSLPQIFKTYSIPLEDSRLPILQRIPSTSRFSLITILELPGCPQLTDDVSLTLKSLHLLIAFDASDTKLSSWGLRKVLMPPLLVDENEELGQSSGLLHLRILRLRDCKSVDQTIFKSLGKLSLLSVLDLRGTSVDPATIPTPYNAWSSACLDQPSHTSLYHPTPLIESISLLKSISTTSFYPSDVTFHLHIDKIHYQPGEQRSLGSDSMAVEIQNKAFTFTSGSTMLSHGPQVADVDISSESTNGDYMLSVAARESRELAARQKVRSFYSHPVLRLSKKSRYEGYSAGKYYREKYLEGFSTLRMMARPRFNPLVRRISAEEDSSSSSSSPLMLYRPPPPWASESKVEDVASDSLNRNRNSQSANSFIATTAVTSKSHPKMQQMIADLTASRSSSTTPSRMSTAMAMATFDGVKSSSSAAREVTKLDVAKTIRPMLQGKNPFRRSDTPGTARAIASGTMEPVSASASVSTTSNSATSTRASSLPRPIATTSKSTFINDNGDRLETASSTPKRTLKPISSVRVPELPPEEMRKLKDSMMKKSRVSLPGGSGGTSASASDTRRKSLPGRDGDIKKMISIQRPMANTFASAPSSAQMDSKRPLALALGPSEEDSESRPKGKKRLKTGFDWKSWGSTS